VYLKSSKTIKAPGKAEKKNKAIKEDSLIEDEKSNGISRLEDRLSGIKDNNPDVGRIFSKINENGESKKEIPGALVDM